MSYRVRILILGGLVALPLLLLALTATARDQMERERALTEERVAVAQAVAAAVEGFLDRDTAALQAIASLPAVRDFERTSGEELDDAMLPIFEAFPNVETIGLIGPDGWNVRSLTSHVPVEPRTVNVSDRPYFREAMATGQVVFGSAVLSRVRPGVPVVAIAVPIMPAANGGPATPRGVLVGTLSLGQLLGELSSMAPDSRLGIVLVDSNGQMLVGPGVDPAATRDLTSLRGRPDVDEVLQGRAGSQQVWAGEDGENLLVSYAPVERAGWGVLVQQPVTQALAPARAEATRSIGLLVLALGLSFLMALFLSSRLARADAQREAARREAEQGRERLALLAEWSRHLASTLDYEATLQAIARLTVPALADWCVVDLVAGNHQMRRLVVGHADPAKAPLARALEERYPVRLQASAVARAAFDSEPLLAPEVGDDFLRAAARDEEHLRLLREMAPRSLMIVPLAVRDRALGAISFVAAESGRRYGPDDLQLAREVANRAALAVENARLYGEVQQAVRTRDEFLAAASHDLKNPLSSVKLQAQLLQRRAGRSPEIKAADVIDSAERIDGIVTRATALVDELLDIARLQLNQPLDLQRQSMDLVHLAREAVTEAQATDRHRLRVEALAEPVIGEWDARRLRRVVDNLLNNAIKYSPDGGEVVITVEREGDDQAASAVLRVHDHGLGVPKEDLPRLFERFQRGGNVVGRIAGAGVGLANARHIVESHGGTIALESAEGQGSVATIRLPLPVEAVHSP